jgi:hypothetical protein
MEKKSAGILRFIVGPLDYFSVVFPVHATKEDRLLLMMATFMTDYMYFNDRPDKGKIVDGIKTAQKVNKYRKDHTGNNDDD